MNLTLRWLHPEFNSFPFRDHQESRVQKIQIHPEFNRLNAYYNFAILYLETPVSKLCFENTHKNFPGPSLRRKGHEIDA